MAGVDASQQGKAKVFAREATGLVREVSAVNASVFGASSGPLGEYIVFSIPFGLGLFAAAQVWPFYASTLIAALFSVFILINYAVLTAAMPRSGGDYVYTSRIWHPAIGFGSSFSLALWQVVGAGAFAAIAVKTIISPALTILGAFLGSSTLVSWGATATEQAWVILLGGLLLGLVSVLFVSGTQRALRVNTVIWSIGMVALTLMLIALVLTSRSDFVSRFNTAMGSPAAYQGIIDAAQRAGFATRSDWTMVWPLVGVAMAVFGWYFWLSYIGGEVKQARSLQRELWMMFVPLIITTVYVLAILAAAFNTFGYEFLASASYLSFVDPSQLAAPVAAGAPVYFTGLALGSGWLAALFIVGFVAWAWPLPVIFILLPIRCALAWSLDQVFPSSLTEVNPRTHTPVRMTILVAVLAFAFTVISTFTNQVVQLFAVMIMATAIFSQGVTGITAALFPYRMRHLYLQQPEWVRRKVLGVPLLVLSGILAAAFTVFWIASMFVFAPEFGFNSTYGLLFLVVFLVGLAIFYGMRAYKESKGIPVHMAFREIPPE